MQDFLNYWHLAQQRRLRFCVRWSFHDRVVIPERLPCPILIMCLDGIEDGLMS
jgi:hypothetical protein